MLPLWFTLVYFLEPTCKKLFSRLTKAHHLLHLGAKAETRRNPSIIRTSDTPSPPEALHFPLSWDHLHWLSRNLPSAVDGRQRRHFC